MKQKRVRILKEQYNKERNRIPTFSGIQELVRKTDSARKTVSGNQVWHGTKRGTVGGRQEGLMLEDREQLGLEGEISENETRDRVTL